MPAIVSKKKKRKRGGKKKPHCFRFLGFAPPLQFNSLMIGCRY